MSGPVRRQALGEWLNCWLRDSESRSRLKLSAASERATFVIASPTYLAHEVCSVISRACPSKKESRSYWNGCGLNSRSMASNARQRSYGLAASCDEGFI